MAPQLNNTKMHEGAQKRTRRNYSESGLNVFQSFFLLKDTPSSFEAMELSRQTGAAKGRVAAWLKNKRANDRKRFRSLGNVLSRVARNNTDSALLHPNTVVDITKNIIYKIDNLGPAAMSSSEKKMVVEDVRKETCSVMDMQNRMSHDGSLVSLHIPVTREEPVARQEAQHLGNSWNPVDHYCEQFPIEHYTELPVLGSNVLDSILN